jgi:transcriptional regulator with XRE-family HTH domain
MADEHPYFTEIADFRWQFSLKLKPLRKAKFRSQEKFGRHADLHRTTIGGLEQGKTDPPLSTLLILSDALGVPVEELIRDLPVVKHRKPPPSRAKKPVARTRRRSGKSS